jgi:hypothetical protein
MSAAARRRVRTIGLAVLFLLVAPGVAHADPAGPTDYRSEIIAIEPATDAVDVSIEGGDAFVRVAVAPGHEVIALGYDEEPYLRIDPDGVVWRNVRSYATYYNEERYGGSDIPDLVDNEAAPEWERIGDGGSWAWHDHRAHFMGTAPPINMDPGDSFPPVVVPIVVDGERVSVEVMTTLQAEPSWLPSAVGALVGLQVVLVAGLLGPATRVFGGLVLGGAALVAGTAQFLSLPAETGPAFSWWALPVLALAGLVATIAIYGRSPLVQHALVALAGLFLTVWAFSRRDGLTSAIIPTDLPFWLDRAITAGCLVGGATLAVTSMLHMFSPIPPRAASPHGAATQPDDSA